MILFDEKQRSLFEMLPKPGIMDPEKLNKKSAVLKNPPIKSRKSFIQTEFTKSDDYLVKRMIKMIDPQEMVEKKIDLFDKSFFFSRKFLFFLIFF